MIDGFGSVNPPDSTQGWWGIEEGIQCSLEEVTLLNVAKIWTLVCCHKQNFRISMDLGAHLPYFLFVHESW